MKILKIALTIIALSIITIISATFAISPGGTPAFLDENNNVVAHSIAEMKYVNIDGTRQFVLVRGVNKNNPVLLVVHGGPGISMLTHHRNFNAELEQHYTVAYWEQRGVGKSTAEHLPPDSYSVGRFVEDAHQITAFLKTQFNKEKIFILGHSWGSLIGIKTVHKYPNDYIAYIGTGQFGDAWESERLAYQFALEKARDAKDLIAMKNLNQIGGFNDVPLNENYINNRSYVTRFGGMLVEAESLFDILISPVLWSDEYNIGDKYAFISGAQKSAEDWLKMDSFNLTVEAMNTDLTLEVPEVKVPVYFLQGKHDFLTNYYVAKDYFDQLIAPKKVFITFDYSAHFVPFEEAEKFNNIMIDKVLDESQNLFL